MPWVGFPFYNVLGGLFSLFMMIVFYVLFRSGRLDAVEAFSPFYDSLYALGGFPFYNVSGGVVFPFYDSLYVLSLSGRLDAVEAFLSFSQPFAGQVSSKTSSFFRSKNWLYRNA